MSLVEVDDGEASVPLAPGEGDRGVATSSDIHDGGRRRIVMRSQDRPRSHSITRTSHVRCRHSFFTSDSLMPRVRARANQGASVRGEPVLGRGGEGRAYRATASLRRLCVSRWAPTLLPSAASSWVCSPWIYVCVPRSATHVSL